MEKDPADLEVLLRTLPRYELKSFYDDLYLPYLKELKRYSGCGPGMTIDEMQACMDRGMCIYEIRCGRHIVGFIMTERVYERRSNLFEDMQYIMEMYVVPKYRRQRVGTRAFAEFINKTDIPIFLYVIRDNKGAVGFWNKMFEVNALNLRVPPKPIIEFAGGLLPFVACKE